MNKSISIEVPILARVEGEGALELTLHQDSIQELRLKIYEPPRLFEKFLENRSYLDVLDFVARICGICPVAYQMSAVHALEQCFRTHISPWIREMRRLFYCGEWIESHSLHIHLLAAPDIFHCSSAAELAKVHPQEVRRGLRLQAFGNALIKLLGGRSVHPVGACVGGFYHAPSRTETDVLLKKAKERLEDCRELITWLAHLDLPNNSHPFPSVSLYHPREYPMNEGNIVSNQGLNISKEEFLNHFKEFQVPYSTALHCKLHDKTYLVGPMARINNCFQHLPNEILTLLSELKIEFPSQNMHYSILARAVEIYYCVLEAIRILTNYTVPESSYIPIQPILGEGYGCTEAPRGLLWHHYEIDDHARVKSARIIPPTSQNQARIEEDLRNSLLQFGLKKTSDDIRAYSERIIRNYDPCISCSTHFLKLNLKHV